MIEGLFLVGFYLDLGVGWLQELPMDGEVTANGHIMLEQQARVSVESPFLDIGAGFETEKRWYIEIRRFGVLDDPKASITVLKFGKRIEF